MLQTRNDTSIHPAARLGAVHLTVADLESAVDFYRDRLGMAVLNRDGGTVRLGASERDAVLALHARPGARRPARATGLYHAAILVPSRGDLARTIRRLASTGARFQGFSDHGVSEAAYLADPEGNGLEIYRDRPREEWRRDEAGGYVLGLDPLDVEGLLAEEERQGESAPAPLAAGTTLGHVHLRVADLAVAEDFYVRIMGFEVTARYDRSALFVSAGGYHHHVGLNTWHSLGAPAPPPGAAGLDHVEIVLPDAAERDRVAARIERSGVAIEDQGGERFARDPSGNGWMLLAQTKTPAR
jgi:catechol 2,3-dioxygenase